MLDDDASHTLAFLEATGQFSEDELARVARALEVSRTLDVSGETFDLGVEEPAPAPQITPETSDRYTRLGPLGRGAMGDVVLVHDNHLGRDIARKELINTVNARRFLREARVTAQLEHPSIVPVHELGRGHRGELYYTMKRIHGGTLIQAFRSADGLNERLDLLGRFIDACNALGYAHSRGVVHRDVKPDNIMVGPFGETLVVDWGIAKVPDETEDGLGGRTDEQIQSLDRILPPITGSSTNPSNTGGSGSESLTRVGSVLGTPRYMSPEQARGETGAVGPASDVWSLGIVLVELLTGQRAYNGPADEVMKRIRMGLPPAPPSEGPPELIAIALRAAHPDPGERYTTGVELAEDLRRWQTGAVVDAYSYSTREQIERLFKQHKVAAAAGVACVLSLAIAAPVLWAEREQAVSARSAAQAALSASELRTLELLSQRAELTEPSAALALARAQATLDPSANGRVRRLANSYSHYRGIPGDWAALAPSGRRAVVRTEGEGLLLDPSSGETLARYPSLSAVYTEPGHDQALVLYDQPPRLARVDLLGAEVLWERTITEEPLPEFRFGLEKGLVTGLVSNTNQLFGATRGNPSQIVDARTGQVLYETESGVWLVGMSSDGESWLERGLTEIYLVDSDGSRTVISADGGDSYFVGKHLFRWFDSEIWRVKDGTRWTVPGGILGVGHGDASAVVLSGDRQLIAYGVEEGEPEVLASLAHLQTNNREKVAMSPDGTLAGVSVHGGTEVVDVTGAHAPLALPGASELVIAANRGLTARSTETLRFYESLAGPLRIPTAEGTLRTFLATDRHVYLGMTAGVARWTPSTGETLWRTTEREVCGLYAWPDGSIAIDELVLCFDSDGGNDLTMYQGRLLQMTHWGGDLAVERELLSDGVATYESSSARVFVSINRAGCARVYRPELEMVEVCELDGAIPFTAALEGNRLFFGDGTVVDVDGARRQQLELVGLGVGFESLSASPDGRFVASGSGEVFDAQSLERVAFLPTGEPLTEPAWSPSGRFVVFGGEALLDLESGSATRDLPCGGGRAAFGTDGLLVLGDTFGGVCALDAASGALLGEWRELASPALYLGATDGHVVAIPESGAGVAWPLQRSVSPKDAGQLTNLRVCRSDFSVIPVLPYPDPESVWAPANHCPP